ncbi:hypothetical protein [Chitinophaga ginsengisoli]|uniref:Uncharacterized protein n=1 Tax=Chitinophaga ginsengisoli TaxID=363837 RepID=A0A2P8FNR6_9BACT|nr:hypothetical protein [Chitinophaga ginsengisoli]PSL23357.1 hypothetical protein CLV42_11874 [Chitinophaga ginsengisoli]
MTPNSAEFRKEIKAWLIIFIVSLLLSGITAFPVETELQWVCSWWPWPSSTFYKWLYTCYLAIKDTNAQYPYLAYGYDWLAFAHIVIAIAFIGPLKDPVKNIWSIEFGCIACIAVIPLAFIAGYIRKIPVHWRLIDCSFGVIGIIPLLICHRRIRQLEKAIA